MRVRGIIAATAAIALGALVVASPASADPAVLAAGQRITVVQSIEPDAPEENFFEASPTDATATAVGSSNFFDDIEGIDVNDDGLGYAVGYYEFDDEDGPVPALYTADANTGVLSNPLEIQVLEDEADACTGIDLQPNGEILIACMRFDDNFGVEAVWIGSVELDADGALMTPDVTVLSSVDVTAPYIKAIAYNAITGILYAFFDFTPQFMTTVDREAGELGPVIDLEDPNVSGADFDRDGTLFVVMQPGDSPPDTPSMLGTVPVAGGTPNIIGNITAADDPLESVFAITVWGKTLPATGPAEIVPLGLGTALLFLAGAAFIATSRMQRRAG